MKTFVAGLHLALTEHVSERALREHLVAKGVIMSQLQLTTRVDPETGLQLVNITMSVSNLHKVSEALETFNG